MASIGYGDYISGAAELIGGALISDAQWNAQHAQLQARLQQQGQDTIAGALQAAQQADAAFRARAAQLVQAAAPTLAPIAVVGLVVIGYLLFFRGK